MTIKKEDVRTIGDIIFLLNKAKNIIDADEVFRAIREGDEENGVSEEQTKKNLRFIEGHLRSFDDQSPRRWTSWFNLSGVC